MGAKLKRSDGILAAVLALAFLPALFTMARVWSSVDYYSHGFLVPLLALWMARDRWPRGIAPAPEPRARLAIAAAIATYAVGLAANLVAVQGVALVGALAAFVWTAWGAAVLAALAFPIAFLLFMVPIPSALLTPVIVDLQLLVSSVAVSFLHLFDFGIAREGNVLLLGNGDSLFVEEACSGITSIVTLLPLAVVLAWFTLDPGWRRALLVALVAPVAMLGNLVRVVATVAAAGEWGAERVTEGSLHESAGLLTFAGACLLLIAIGMLLGRGQPGTPPRSAA
jgi:exosortase